MGDVVWVTVKSPEDLWAKAEATVACTCGLLQVGYRGSWAISHAERCPVTEVYRMLVMGAGHRAAQQS